MRKHIAFVDNKDIGNLIDLFNFSQGELYHYTDKKASANILANKEIYLTRADKFLDIKEINYGLSLLNDVFQNKLSKSEFEVYENLHAALEERFRKCFVVCFTQLNNSEFHISEYGEHILEFCESFPDHIACLGKHSIKNGDSFRMYYATDLYKSIEGMIEYDCKEQLRIATKICDVYKNTYNQPLPPTDTRHFVDVLMKFILLCKEPRYSDEKEYRIGLIANANWDEKFEQVGNNGKVYIKLRVPTEIKKKS